MLPFFVARTETYKKEETPKTIMSTTNFSSGRSHTKSFKELQCSPSLMSGLQQQLSICFLAVDILLCIAAFAGNSLILVALYKESSLHPNSSIVVWQQLICWLVLLTTLSVLYIGCPCFKNTGAFVDT